MSPLKLAAVGALHHLCRRRVNCNELGRIEPAPGRGQSSPGQSRHRIRQEVHEGEMSHVQATRLHRDDHQIRREERLMASQDGGHITRQEDRALNQQENRVSRQIGQ